MDIFRYILFLKHLYPNLVIYLDLEIIFRTKIKQYYFVICLSSIILYFKQRSLFCKPLVYYFFPPFNDLLMFQVSWIRRKDYHLLTVGLTTYSSDDRYQAIHLQHSEVRTPLKRFVHILVRAV